MSGDQSSSQAWWYCLRHQAVEQGPGCPGKERLGPYPTQEQAVQALEQAARRNQQWEEDPRWNDPQQQ